MAHIGRTARRGKATVMSVHFPTEQSVSRACQKARQAISGCKPLYIKGFSRPSDSEPNLPMTSWVTDKTWKRKPPPEYVRDPFFASPEWRALRLVILRRDRWTCQCCGAKASEIVMNVDHIKPRLFYPDLALEPSNLQTLCEECNRKKHNRTMRFVDAET